MPELERRSIKSFVVLDLETSGLPAFGKTRITEIALGGALRDHILSVKDEDFGLPRVIHKLSVCVYPKKMIHYEATEMTGLDNALLEDIQPWDADMYLMLNSFLQRLPPPVCLIAHNGMAFDFRLLKAELAAFHQTLPENIMCADSLLAFQTLFPKSNKLSGLKKEFKGITPLCPVPSTSSSGTELIDHTTNAVLDEGKSSDPTANAVLDTVKNLPLESCEQGSSASFQEVMLESDAAREALRVKNETTPKQEKVPVSMSGARKRYSGYMCEEQDKVTPCKHGKIRKQLFESIEPESHKLPDLYRYILDREPNHGHRAEGDVMSLLECIVATGSPFLDWVDGNYVPLLSIKPMW